MKKITFLLSLLLAFVGVTASAQVAFEVSDAPSDGKWATNTTWYRMSLHDKYLSAYDATINGDIKNQNATPLSGAGAYWCVVGDAASGYKFYNRAAGPGRVLGIRKGLLSDGNSRAFFCASSTNGTSSDPVGTLFSISAVSGKPTEFNIKLNGVENYYWNDRDNYLSYWNTTSAVGNDGSKVQFYKVELGDVEADDNVNADTYKTALQNRLTAAKTAIDDSKVGYFSNAAINAAQAVLDGASSKAGDYYFAKLELQANSPKAGVIYRIQSGYTSFGTTKAIYHDGVAVKWSNEDVTNPSQYWFFTPYGNGYKLQAADAKTYFASAATLSNNAGYVEVAWYAPHVANIRVECGKSLHAQGHNGGKGENGNVVAYDETGFGGETGPCAWNIVEATLDEVKQIQVKTEAAPEYYEGGLKVGSFTNEQKEAFNAKMTASTSMDEALRHINDELPLGGGIDVNKYYRLVCVSPKVDTDNNVDASGNPADPTYTTLTRGQNNVVTAPFSKGNVDQLWKFEQVEGGYYLKNMNGNGYLHNVEQGGDARAKLVENPSYKFEIMSGSVATQKGLHVVGKNNYACLFAENHPNEPTKGDPYAVCGWHSGNDYKDAAWAWYIVEADDVEVALNAVNGKSYATTYLPVGVSAVKDAKAYVAAAPANNETVMTETASFGAKNGVLLVSETAAEKAVLTIGDVASVESALSGTLLAKDITGSQTNYLVFGKNKENPNEVGFFEPSTSVTTIPANRAFFEGAAGAIALNFGGNVTAIDQVVNNANVNAPIFDLAGRRVVKAAKGGVYIQNGKKFIVK